MNSAPDREFRTVAGLSPADSRTKTFGLVRERAVIFRHRSGILLLLFLVSLPLVNPWVRGDGVGYYAYIRSMLIDHNFRFEKDWLAANPSFAQGRVVSGH